MWHRRIFRLSSAGPRHSQRRRLAALASRGPDASHEIAWQGHARVGTDMPATASLHARLSIRDPRPIADQPMASDDGQIWLCYNGEVYGWEAAADAMAECGIPFRTRSDTEFILRAYEEFGFLRFWSICGACLRWPFWICAWARSILPGTGSASNPWRTQPDGIAFNCAQRTALVAADQRAFAPQAIDAFLAHRYIPAPQTVSGCSKTPIT